MLSTRLISRNNLPCYAASVQKLHTAVTLFDSSDSSSSDSDKKRSKKKVQVKPVQSAEEKSKSQQETTNRLNSLLEKMMKDPKGPKSKNLAMPPKKPKEKVALEDLPFEKQLVGAAKDVATALGGDVQKTEAELLNKLLTREKKESTSMSINDVISGMKIDRTPQKDGVSMNRMQRSARVQALAQQLQSSATSKFRTQTSRSGFKPFDLPSGPTEPGNLYNGGTLNIFKDVPISDSPPNVPELRTWNALEKREFKLALTHPPQNYFQEMILWTEEGKLWKFPIDNEQGLEEEQKVHFSEHVFLERHLKDWCPKKGPVRHFMELVCVGLSKNPYMTVSEKKEHIAWYREFFESKKDLLKELGVVESDAVSKKQIEAQ